MNVAICFCVHEFVDCFARLGKAIVVYGVSTIYQSNSYFHFILSLTINLMNPLPTILSVFFYSVLQRLCGQFRRFEPEYSRLLLAYNCLYK